MDIAHANSSDSESTLRRAAKFLMLLFVLSIPLEGALILPGVGSLSRMVGFGVTLYCLYALALSTSIRRVRLEHVFLFGFCAFACSSFFWSIDPEASAGRVVTFVQLAVFCWLIWEFCPKRPTLDWLMQMYVVGAVITCLALFINIVTLDVTIAETGEVRFSAFGINPNEQALGLVLSVPMITHLILYTDNKLRILNVIALVVCPVGVILSTSRAGVIALAAALGIIGIRLLVDNRKQALAVFVLLGLAAIAVVVSLAPAGSLDRLFDIGTEISSGDLNSRTLIWRAGLEAFPDNSLVGIGIGAYPKITGASLSSAISAHSTYLSILVELGWLGFLLLTVALVIITRRLMSMSSSDVLLVISLLIPLALGLLVTQWEYRKQLWFVLALVVGICHSSAKTQNDESKKYGKSYVRRRA